MDEKEALQTLDYTILTEEYEKAFISFQKRYVFPKNIVMTVLFGGIAVLYGQQILVDSSYTAAWVLLAVCLAFIVLIWYNAFKIRKSLTHSIQEIQGDRYTMQVLEDGLLIRTKVANTDETDENTVIEPRRILFETERPEITDTADLFVLYLKKQMFYVIPKRCLTTEQAAFMQEYFQQRLGKKYVALKQGKDAN